MKDCFQIKAAERLNPLSFGEGWGEVNKVTYWDKKFKRVINYIY